MTSEQETTTRDRTRAEQALLAGLVEYGLFVPSEVPGIYGRGVVYEAVLAGFNHFLSQQTREDGACCLHFPPIMPRANLERIGYLESFPHLAGLVFSFEGGDVDHLELLSQLQNGESYAGAVKMTDVVLNSATCQPLYPTLRGKRLPDGGSLFDLVAYCFRREPSHDPIRMQSFRMREHVCLGHPADVRRWRERWLVRAREMFQRIGLKVDEVVANDPFFGRGGRMLATEQRASEAKFEFVLPISSTEAPTAIMSFNYHEDHFTGPYDIRTSDGARAHSACLGIGIERIAIALFKTHGFDPETWPASVRAHLGLSGKPRPEGTPGGDAA